MKLVPLWPLKTCTIAGTDDGKFQVIDTDILADAPEHMTQGLAVVRVGTTPLDLDFGQKIAVTAFGRDTVVDLERRSIYTPDGVYIVRSAFVEERRAWVIQEEARSAEEAAAN